MPRACPYRATTYHWVCKATGKTGRGDLVIKDDNLCGTRHTIIDVACIHEFCGNRLADVSCKGQLRDPDVNKLLETAVHTKVARYRDAYAHTRGHKT